MLFALGLVIGGMTRPDKVIGFLDFFGNWDPSLAFVMGGAIAAHMPLQRYLLRNRKPLLSAKYLIPTRNDLDVKLVVGAVFFGVGWGLAGYCPWACFGGANIIYINSRDFSCGNVARNETRNIL